MKYFWFEHAYIEGAWAAGVNIAVDQRGYIDSINIGPALPSAKQYRGLAMPGFSNAHSHSFQRAMAGLSEVATSSADSFWTWRKVMYQFASALTPQDLAAIARLLYVEMLKAGYTSVAEFHYLHNQVDGPHYQPIGTMAEAVIGAADSTGIGLTLLPVLYMSSGFGAAPLNEHQRRFGHSLDSYQTLLTELSQRLKGDDNKRLGMALHSLRAVPESAVGESVSMLNGIDPEAPIHIHIAEQKLEVQDCLAYCGKRPVEWLLENQSLSSRWCLIHATHINEAEIKGIAESKAVVGICPTTEANLGDGLFPMAEFLSQQGCYAIGSDSNTSISPIEELRWLEYGQRLKHQQRNVMASTSQPHTAEALIAQSGMGGAAALGRDCGSLAVAKLADIVVLDDQQVNLYGKPERYRFDALMFSGNQNLVKDVLVAGREVINNGRHVDEAQICEDYKNTLAKLQALL